MGSNAKSLTGENFESLGAESSSSRSTTGARNISFDEFIDIILRLRGGNASTVADMVFLREFMRGRLDALEEDMLLQRQILGTFARSELNGPETSRSGGTAVAEVQMLCADTEQPPAWAERILEQLSELDAGQRELREELRDLRGRVCQ